MNSSGKVKCTCGWSWNKSDSSKKDMYICHQCGRDNSNNMKNGGWLDSYEDGGTMQEHQENYNDNSVSLPEGYVGEGYDTTGRNYSPAWGGQFEEGGEIPMAQNGKRFIQSIVPIGNANLFANKAGEWWIDGKLVNKPKNKPKNNSRTLNVVDPRKKMATTNKPLRPNSDLVSGKYNSKHLDKLMQEAKRQGLSKSDMMNLSAMGFQETKWGRSDGNIGHVLGNWKGDDYYQKFISAYKEKMKEADRLGIKDPATRLQVYNGLGTVTPKTEKNYHGFEMQKIYGVPIPKGGINMKKNPLYGTQVIDIRDNVLANNPEYLQYMDSIYKAPVPKYMNDPKVKLNKLLNDPKKRQMGGLIPMAQNGNRATRADSLAVYNNAKKVEDFYNSKNYKLLDSKKHYYLKGDEEDYYGLKQVLFRDRERWIEPDWNERDAIRTTVSKGVRKDYNLEKNRPKNFKDIYSKKIDKNKIIQRERSNNLINLDAPPQYFDFRIQPQTINSYRDVSKGTPTSNDKVEIYKYDPLAVKPFNMLTDAEKKLRVQKYGTDGVPKSYIKGIKDKLNKDSKPSPNKKLNKDPKTRPQQQEVIQPDLPRVEAISLPPMQQLASIAPPTTSDVVRKPKSYNVNVKTYNTKGGLIDYYTRDLEGVDYEKAMRMKSMSDAFNRDILERYGPQNEYRTPKSAAEAAERLKQLRSEFNITPNYQMGGSVYPVNYVPQAQNGKLTFLQPTSDKLPEGYRIPYADPSSELAMSIGGENGEPAYLIPSFKYGKPLADPIGEFKKTGEHLGGPFKTWQEADEWERTVRHPYVEQGKDIPMPIKTWGEMAMGGSIPGAVGFTYARTNDPAPSNGPYAKKTMASAQNGAWLDNYDVAQNGEKIENDSANEEPQFAPILIEEVVIKRPLTNFAKIRGQIKKQNTWEDYAQRYLGNFEKNMGQTINNLPEYRKQEYEDYVNKLAFDEYVKKYPKAKGEDRGAYIDRIQAENAGSSNFERAYEANAPYNDETDINKWRKSLMGLGSLVLPKLAMDELKQNSDYFSKKEKQAMIDNPISTYVNDVMGTVEPLSIPVESIYGNKSFGQIASGESADIPMSMRILGDPLMVLGEAAPLLNKGISAGAKVLGTEEGLLSNAYKYNPWAFKLNPEAYYRGIGKEGMDDILNSGIIRSKKQNAYPEPYFSKGKIGDAYAKGYFAELNNEPMKGVGSFKTGDLIQTPVNTVSINNPNLKLYQKDWLQGYKPIEVPKNYTLPDPPSELNLDINQSGFDLLRTTPKVKKKRLPQWTEVELENGLIEKTPLRKGINNNVVKQVDVPGKGEISLKTSTDASGNPVYYFSANVPEGGLSAGKAFKYLEQFIPKGSKILEPRSLSTDSFYNMLRRAENPKQFTWVDEGQFIPLNNSGKNKLFSNSDKVVPGAMNVKFENYDEAMKALNEFNSRITINGMPKAKLSETVDEVQLVKGGPWIKETRFGIDVPNIGLIKEFKEGGVIKDDRGQWAYPGEITEIGSPYITMKGVPYDVLGISDTGDTKLMKPGKNYKFKGKKVTEYPMAKNGLRQEQKGLVNLDQLTNFTNYNTKQPGGWLDKY